MTKMTIALFVPLLVIGVLTHATDEGGGSAQAFAAHGSVWSGNSATYFVNPNFVDATAGTSAQQLAALQRAAAEWKCAGQTPFQFQYGGATSVTTVAPTDGTNAVFYTSALSSGALATATWSFTTGGATQNFVGFDIVFFNGTSTLDFIWSLNPTLAQFDIESVGVHEFGHAIGLGHSAVSGATMAASISAGSTAPRTLAADDIAGVQSLYGSSPTGTPTITAISPSFGWIGGGTRVTITGTNLAGGDPHTVTFNGVAATDVTVLDSGRLECTAPASTQEGFCTVSFTHAQGTVDASNGYFYSTLRLNSALSISNASQLEVYLPDSAGLPYQAAPAFGFQAGIPLSQVGDPGDTRVVPINRDSLFNSFLLLNMHQNVFTSFSGTLDGSGRAFLTVDLPAQANLVGVVLCFCAISQDDMAPSGIRSFTNAEAGLIGP